MTRRFCRDCDVSWSFEENCFVCGKSGNPGNLTLPSAVQEPPVPPLPPERRLPIPPEEEFDEALFWGF